MFCPQCIYVFCVDLRTNSDFLSIQQQIIGFYNRARECFLRGTNWVLELDRYSFVLKGLNDRAEKNIGPKWDKLLYLEIIKLYEGGLQNFFPLQLNITE